MKLLRTMILLVLLPGLLLPAGASICLCKLLGVQAVSTCATCHVTCCTHEGTTQGSTELAAAQRDCFLKVAVSDPVKIDHAKYDVVTRGTDAPVAMPPVAVEPRPFLFTASISVVSVSRRVSATPLFSSALPLRL